MCSYMSYVFGELNGKRISFDDFLKKHSHIPLTREQQKDFISNLEMHASSYIRDCMIHKTDKKDPFLCRLVYNTKTGECFFKPLYNTNIGVFFKELPTPLLLIYDMRIV